MTIWDDQCKFWNIGIAPEYRRQGIGSQVYNYIESVFYRDRCDEIKIDVVSEAVPFWTAVGFKQSGIHPHMMKKNVSQGEKPFDCEV